MKENDNLSPRVRAMSPEQRAEYDRMTAGAYQLQMDLKALEDAPQIFGYARVSTPGQAREGNSLEDQIERLQAAGAAKVFTDTYTGTTTDRPELDKLLSVLRPGDTVVVTKLDRMARSTLQGLQLVQDLTERGITVNVLNMGTISNKPEDKVRLTMFLAIAEYERETIMQRTRAGKEIARRDPNWREGRKPTYSAEQLDHALDLLSDHSYSEVARMTGISKSTLHRARRSRAVLSASEE